MTSSRSSDSFRCWQHEQICFDASGKTSMALEIEKQFSVKAPKSEVWKFLTDPHRVAACLPGAAITGQEDEQTYTGTMTVKVGPVKSSYKGKLRFERLDPEAGTAELTAVGQDIRGKGGADMRMVSRMVEGPGGETLVTVTSEVSVTGILAQFGRGMIQDVSDQMFEQFTAAMRVELESGESGVGGRESGTEGVKPDPGAPEALDGVAFGVAVGKRAAGRLVRRSGFWAAVVILVVAIYWIWLR